MRAVSRVVMGGMLLATTVYVRAQSLEVGAVLPQLRGETLAGAALVLPDAARGRAAFLTVTFSKEAGQRASAWNERFRKDQAVAAKTNDYSIAMLEGAPRLFRGMIKLGIKRGVPRESHKRFLIVTRDEAAWRQYLKVYDADVPYLILLDGNGRLIWMDRGAFSEKMYQELRKQIADLQQP